MNILKILSKTGNKKANGLSKNKLLRSATSQFESIEENGRDQIRELVEKGLSFRVTLL